MFLFVVFLLDAIGVAAAAWLLACAAGHARRGPLEAGTAWLLAGLAWVAASGIVLGQIGQLHAGGFLGLHAVGLGALLWLRRRSLAADRTLARECGRALRDSIAAPGAERALLLGLGAALGLLVILAAWAEPVVYDGLTYRLPRIGAWLQSGRIALLGGADPRLDYMPVVPEVVMAWILGATPDGFHFLALAQAWGGILTVAATLGLARESGLSRTGSLLAGLSLLGLANVVGQFTSTHTDLFTAGVLSAAFWLGWRGLRHGEGSWLGGAGAGLALGAKGTVFYFAPGLLLWVAWLAWRHRAGGRAWRRIASAALLGGAVFAGPGFLRNWQAYGSLFGPADSVRLHQRRPESGADLAEKLGRNLRATLAQLCEPHSQPLGLQAAGRAAGQALAAGLPERDADAFEARGRRGTLEDLLARREPDADVSTCGLPAFVLLLAAGAVALVRIRTSDAQLVLLWLAGLAAFVLFLSAIQQWHGYSFRFYVLGAPWLAVAGAWALERLAPPWRAAGWTLVLAAGATVAGPVLATTHQIGWRAIVQPAQSRGYFLYQQWRDWAHELAGEARGLTVALPPNLPLAAFFRPPHPNPVRLAVEPAADRATAEQAVPADHSWLIVTAGRFLGREGNVAVKTCLFRGDEASAYSLAAYRRLRPGEAPAPVLYRQRESASAGEVRHELLIKSGPADRVRLVVANPESVARAFSVTTPQGRTRGSVEAGQTLIVEIAVPADAVSEVNLIIPGAPTAGPAAGRVSVRLADETK